MSWYNISHRSDVSDGMVLTEAYAESSSPWFSGHFPGEPILPGIAILSMVKDVLRHSAAKKGHRIRVSHIRRVRFKLPVRPNQMLKILLTFSRQDEGLSCHFKVESKENIVCTGIILAQLLLEECHVPDVHKA